MTIWLTGLPCSGKTTLGKALVERLREEGHKAALLDGDVVRSQFWPELGFSKRDRDKNVERFGALAEMMVRSGVVAVVAVVSPYRVTRDLVRARSTRFMEVFVDAPAQVCEKRDVKGMYRKARTGEIAVFTGVSDPYEEPLWAEVEVKTDVETVEESVGKILEAMRKGNYESETGQVQSLHQTQRTSV